MGLKWRERLNGKQSKDRNRTSWRVDNQEGSRATFEEMGDDLAQLYEKGRNRIFSVARKKIPDVEDGKRANLRVARDVLWNGAFCDEAIGAEYFGGILAASRTVDGRSDDAIPFVDAVKAMSSSQLRLLYDFCHSLSKSLMERTTRSSVFELPRSEEIFVFWLTNGIDPASLMRLVRISSYSFDIITIDRTAYPYCSARPSLFGIMRTLRHTTCWNGGGPMT